MRSRIFIYSFLPALLLSGQSTIPALYNSNARTSQNIIFKKPAELIYEKGMNKHLRDRFFPIGWSPDGKFAYATEPADIACGCYFLNVFVQDMVTDKISWKWQSIDYDNKMNLDKVWQLNTILFTDSLLKFNIRPEPNRSLKLLPLRINNAIFDFSLINDTYWIPDITSPLIKKTAIFLKRNGTIRKKVFTADYAGIVLSNAIKGYLKSPFEDRIALFYMKENLGHEGGPNILRFNLIGIKPASK